MSAKAYYKFLYMKEGLTYCHIGNTQPVIWHDKFGIP